MTPEAARRKLLLYRRLESEFQECVSALKNSGLSSADLMNLTGLSYWRIRSTGSSSFSQTTTAALRELASPDRSVFDLVELTGKSEAYIRHVLYTQNLPFKRVPRGAPRAHSPETVKEWYRRMVENGDSLEVIAREVGLTRERIRQILWKNGYHRTAHSIRREESKKKRAEKERLRKEAIAAKEAKYQQVYDLVEKGWSIRKAAHEVGVYDQTAINYWERKKKPLGAITKHGRWGRFYK